MAAPEYGPWSPLNLPEIVELFERAPFRWWISGGRALELHLGRTWREHEDVDVGLVRTDAPGLRDVLRGWDVLVADGALSPWAGDVPTADNLWCRRAPGEPWALDLTVGDGSSDEWIYKRDRSVRLPWDEAVLRSPDGVAYLAPEVQLLFKGMGSLGIRPKDQLDAVEVVPALEPARRRWLSARLPPDHPWQALV